MLIYLASPYSHPDKTVMHDRFDIVCHVAAKLMGDGVHLYCPIAHTHPIAVRGRLPRGLGLLGAVRPETACSLSGALVVTMDGWQDSKGVAAELKIAGELGLPVKYLEPVW